jgi:hypothetical protein
MLPQRTACLTEETTPRLYVLGQERLSSGMVGSSRCQRFRPETAALLRRICHASRRASIGRAAA